MGKHMYEEKYPISLFYFKKYSFDSKGCIHESLKSPSGPRGPLGASGGWSYLSHLFDTSLQHITQWLKARLLGIVSATAADHAFN